MLYVSSAIKCNSFQFLLKCENIIIYLGTANLFHVFPRVAQIGTGLALVISVVSKTQPAKFVPALSTRHMHATLIFLYIGLALWTWFSI